MKYFVYLNNKEYDSIAKQSFLMSKNLHSTDKSGFYFKFVYMIEQYHFYDLDPESVDNISITRYATDLKYKSFWRHSLEH